jgi:hypothetical protein
MEFVKKNPVPVAAVLFVVGFLLGWMLMGWVIWPVEYINGDIAHLRPDLKQDYVRVVASAYANDLNADRAAQRIAFLGSDAAKVIADTVISGQSTDEDKIQVAQLQATLESMGKLNPPEPGSQPGSRSFLSRFGLPLVGCAVVFVLLLVVGGLLYLRFMSKDSRSSPPKTAAVASSRLSAEATRTDYSAPGGALATPTGTPPVAQFMTTYVLGDDLYDDSFSVDGPDGNFLGECGMGISETIGVGDPKKVTAFEVWLFDKNDIRTVTRVLMSEHAFRDEALKSRLAAKGEPVMLKAGDTVSMETATLVVTARVVDMAYGGGALPPNSFFERLTIELAAFAKPAAS